MMVFSKFKHLTALVILLIALPACGSTITTDCEEAAQAQCDLCYICAVDAPADSNLNNITGGALCRAEGNKTACVEQLTRQCEEQATGRQQTNEEIQACTESLESASCMKIHQAYALDKSYATPACQRYF